ncbi:MAG: carbamoyltransferase C-terminal domain-containing protein [Candidatus Cloacimonetes bacterium]|nr:carbamoyltransferase C-terminal domain-containing protein [Candidatus Cloacimonadota bacterium]
MNILAIHTQHDANITISSDNEIVLVLELERVFRKRYFECSNNELEFEREWKIVMDIATHFTQILEFDFVITNWVIPSKLKILKKIIKAKGWLTCDHHLAHAALGYYDSNLKNPLILSFDGGGNDGVFNFYSIIDNKISLLNRSLVNVGIAYRLLATLMPEVTHNEPQPRGGHLSLAGKLMGYSALGVVQQQWLGALTEYYKYFQYPMQALYSLSQAIDVDLEESTVLDNTLARNLAASSQKALEIFTINEIENMLTQSSYDGIVLTGGAALNVINNTSIKDYFNLPVYIPSAPNDCGISLGSILAKFPPKHYQYKAYLGLPLHADLPDEIVAVGRKFTLPEIAHLVVNCNAIIGVARDRAEVGPRALGNRSIICYPDSIQKKEIINDKIKFREWYRPLAPVIKEDSAKLLFGRDVISPFMSFAYPFSFDLQGKFPTVEHIDKTARLQTVSSVQNKWLYDLLSEVEAISGFPILLNTSFNTKGKPLLNSTSEAIEILKSTDLTHVIIEDLIFYKEDFK